MNILCRVCGEPIYNVHPRNLFEHGNETIRRNIEIITGLQLFHDSHMPKHICSCCYLDLEHSISFRTRCLETQKQLQNLKQETSSGRQRVSVSPNFDQFDPLGEDEVELNEYVNSSNEITPPKIIESPKRFLPRVRILRCEESTKETRTTKIHSLEDKQTDGFSRSKCKDAQPKRRNGRTPYTSLAKNYVCDVCGWSFRDISNLKSHVLRHTGVKKFVCKECGWKYFDKSRLMLHIRVHHKGEKPFECRYCGMRFSTSPSRCRHERKRHPKQLPFECDICNKRFLIETTLNSHKELHAQGRLINHCETCKRTFKSVESWKKHNTTKFHFKRLAAESKEDFDLNSKSDGLDDDDIDYDFADSIIEEVDE